MSTSIPQLPPPSQPLNLPNLGAVNTLPTGLPPPLNSQATGQQGIAPTVPAGPALPQGAPGSAPAIKTRNSSRKFEEIRAEWNEAHESLSKNLQELSGIFGEIRFLLQQLEDQLGAAQKNSGIRECIDAVDDCSNGINAFNGGVSKLNVHLQNLKSNTLNSSPEAKTTLDMLESKLSDATSILKGIKVGAAVPANAQATQSAQSLPQSQPLLSSQSNQTPIQQIQQIIQTSSNDFQRHLSTIDSLESKLKTPYDVGFSIDADRTRIANFVNSMSSFLDQCDQDLQNSLNNVRQAPQNNQQQAQQAWSQVRTNKTTDLLYCENQINLMSDDITKIDSDISSITRDLFNFSSSLTAASNSFNVLKANFAQKSTEFSNLNQQMQSPVLSQNDSQQLLKSQQDMQFLTNSENQASQRMQNLFTNYQTMKANLTAHLMNRDDLRKSHKALVDKVKKIKDDLINNP